MILLATLIRPGLDLLLVLSFTLRLLPLEGRSEDDLERALAWRIRIASAAIAASPIWVERLVLAKIPRSESRYDERVGRCEVLSSHGARTAWQVIPLVPEDAALCADPDVDAAIALGRVRWSRRKCWRLPVRQQLAAYATGECESAEGRALSEERWP